MKSRLYAVILAVIVLGYGFFFASRFLFHEDRSLLYTELNTTQKLSETVSLTLKKMGVFSDGQGNDSHVQRSKQRH